MNIAFQTFLKCDKVYNPSEIIEVLKNVRPYFRFAYTNRKHKYFNVPCSFDIETTSFFRSTGNDEQEKVAIMYEWTFGIMGAVIIGRTWEEYVTMMDFISNELNLNENKRLIVYVHNLSFEFQFMRHWFIWKNVFSISPRTPVYALTVNGIEFRCSYILSGYSLEKIGSDLKTYKVKKLVGNLNYDLIRHSLTPLTDKEIAYCVNDVKVVMAYIVECMEHDGNIAKIPLTKTGYVRNYCRNSCFYEPGVSRKKSFKRLHYNEIMKGLRLTVEEYKQLKRAFQGGFTHANPFYSGKVVNDVTSYDFISSYPAVMIAEKYPMSSSEVIKINSVEELNKNLKLYCCLFDIEIYDLESVLWYENYISVSRCWAVIKPVINNGRIVSAQHLFTTVTEQDYIIIRKFYTWGKIRIYNFRRYKKDYLPTDFIKSILKLYEDKTTLKNVSGKEVEYLKSKEMLNSCYGMCVTDIVRDEIIYDGEWKTNTPDYEKEIHKYNSNRGRFLFYPWGVWVTAYARRNLFTGILEFNNDYVYSDTDSVKVINAQSHIHYIEKYNSIIEKQLCKAMNYHNLEESLIKPKTIKGVEKCLGVWDYDGNYSRFKTLGAKRYLVEYSDDKRNPEENHYKISLTVSGLNKKICVPWLTSKYGKEGIFTKFKDSLYIPPDYTGKMTHTYIDELKTGVITDYTGLSNEYFEKSSVHLCKADYSLSISKEYSDYLTGLTDVE